MKRRSRFSEDTDRVKLTPQLLGATAGMTVAQREMFLLRMRIQQVSSQILNAKALSAVQPQADRSPSPEPVYDNHGQRFNTREQRFREKLEMQRAQYIEQAMILEPSFVPPAGYKKPKLTRKIPIPADEYPEYNFIGLIIGPRGNTQKRMEKETNTKIAIRGKGSIVEGKRKHRQQEEQGNDEPLHVYLTGEDKASLDRAEAIIRKILVPVDESSNDHKAKQLRELAAIAGTLRDDVVCRICGEAGHRIYQCTQRTGSAWAPANVRCGICGDRSHPTTDCPTGVKQTVEEKDKVTNDYESFMADLTGVAPAPEDDIPVIPTSYQQSYYADYQQPPPPPQ